MKAHHTYHLGTDEAYQFFMNLPFGETMIEQGGYDYDNPYKFNGKELDQETGLYYYGARYYDPKISMWSSVDPLAEKYPSFNPYNYVLNNPVKLVDPTGKSVGDPPTHTIIDTKMSNIYYSYNKEKGTHNFSQTLTLKTTTYTENSNGYYTKKIITTKTTVNITLTISDVYNGSSRTLTGHMEGDIIFHKQKTVQQGVHYDDGSYSVLDGPKVTTKYEPSRMNLQGIDIYNSPFRTNLGQAGGIEELNKASGRTDAHYFNTPLVDARYPLGVGAAETGLKFLAGFDMKTPQSFIVYILGDQARPYIGFDSGTIDDTGFEQHYDSWD